MEHHGGKSLPLNGEFPLSSRRDYEVFLSFRGPDTRLTITDSLYAAMIRAGIHVFKDDEELRVGEEIGGELLRAISTSKIYVPIFSKDYASSKWCLRELASMVDHRKKDKKVILPIFYEVDASDLKLRTGSYGEALKKHEREFSEDAAKQWKEALREVAGITGWNLKDHGLDKLIRLVLEEVYSKLRSPQTNWCDGLVGIHDHMKAVMKLLSLGTPNVRFIVIYGMGGIGKTTLAKAIFKRISSQFQSCSFLSNIRDKDILSLQKKLSRDILGIRLPEVIDADEGWDMIKERFNNNKVILVLDNMDKRDQLMKLASESSCFGLGSRIIITTRNTYFLASQTDDDTDDNIIPLNHRDFFFYEMRELQFHHALQLFNKCSFGNDSPPHDYIDISHEIVKTTGGLPLALEVIGSSLHLKRMRTWKDILKKLKEVPNPDVQKKLLISYNELDNNQKQIFLDIACHCIDEERILAHYMWKACGFSPKTELNVLIHLSLIKVIEDDKFWMHDQLRDLGRDIVRQEGILHLGRCSRLWHPRDALNVVQNHMETENIKALKLMGLADGHNFTREEFSRLPSLRFLELDGGNFVGDFKNLLLNLTWLSWCHCPLNLQANSLCLKNLAVLKLSENDITEDWNGWGPCMVNDNLKVIYLTSCKRLMRTPDFSKCTNLKRLVIKDCKLLEEINSSIGQLGCLKYLEISEEPCRWIECAADISVPPPLLPDSIGGLKKLSMLKVENLNTVKALPHSIGELSDLEHMSLCGCFFLGKLPDSVGELRSLLFLDLFGTYISTLPDSIGRLELLIIIDLSSTNIAKLPTSIGNLRRLKFMYLNQTKIRELPKSICTLENLEDLIARRCRYLEGKIPSEIAGLSQLTILNLSKSKVSGVPTTINRLSNLRELVLTNCNGLQSIPDLPTSLTKLKLSSSPLQAVPDLPCRLPTSLTKLKLSSSPLQAVPDLPCRHSLSSSFFLSFFWVGLSSSFPLLSLAYFLYCRQYSKLEWLGRLHKLQTLRLVFPNFNLPPTDLSSLSQLRSLKITCRDPRSLTRLPSSLENLRLEDVKKPIEWPLFSNLGNLSELKLFGCQLREIEFDIVLGQLENLRRLQVGKCERLVRLSNLSSLKELRVLTVEHCPQLLEMESPKLEKLRWLRVYYCESVQKLPDIPNACEVRFYPQR